jgi:GMP synthase-like glutamine amidotransferase
MKPVLVLQHLPDDGPAFLATWLAGQGVATDLRHTSAGDAFPDRIDGHGALAVLGGEWSANDDRPSLRQAEALIRQAVAAGVPVLGHCLGGQLMARALGARVAASPAPERGWHAVQRLDTAAARAWLGEEAEPVLFQWHRDAFALPDGAEALATSAACPHQAFALGPHLAMQFHVEVDAAKLQAWATEAGGEPAAAAGVATVDTWHGAERLRADAARHLEASQALARHIYTRWLLFAR